MHDEKLCVKFQCMYCTNYANYTKHANDNQIKK